MAKRGKYDRIDWILTTELQKRSGLAVIERETKKDGKLKNSMNYIDLIIVSKLNS